MLGLLYSIRAHAGGKGLPGQVKFLSLQQYHIARRTTDASPSVALMCQDSKYAPYQDASKLSLLLALRHQGEVETGLLPTQVEKCAVLFHASTISSVVHKYLCSPSPSLFSQYSLHKRPVTLF